MAPVLKIAFITVAAASTAYAAGSLADIDHVVLFMQENRAFDHYFGTMAGVRGFADPNVQVNPDGRSTFQQKVDKTLSAATDTLYPWYLNYLGGTWSQATQCMEAGSNGWDANHDALNNDLNDNWPIGNTPWSIGHFTRAELPAHFAIAEGWTVGDMYQEGVIASTDPNRVTWMSGKINNGSSYYIDNNESPGCEATNLNCYPLTWKTIPEYWESAGVSWKVFQDSDNFDDNSLAWFKQYQTAAKGSNLNVKGMSFTGLQSFYAAAAAGTLPQVSIIVGPAELSEHPPYEPRDGAWLQSKVVQAVTSSPAYNKTALIISYDETGGWGDHVTPYHSPNGTAVEWIQDPYGEYGYVYTGPGFRLPFYIISPWTRGGKVYVEHADHTSQIMFVEQWLASKGKNVKSNEVAAWRRANMADLTKAFDFAHPDYTLPSIPNITYPSTDSKGNWNGYAVCESTYKTTRPPVPYGNQTASSALTTEQGFKGVRGQLTEGRYLVFESSGYALSSANGVLSTSTSTAKHDTKSQRFVIHSVRSNKFSLTGAADSKSVGTYTVTDLGNGQGYTLQGSNGQYVSITGAGQVTTSSTATKFQVFSVTYAN
nr:non-hemolytic phospholipase c [Quercus suber]